MAEPEVDDSRLVRSCRKRRSAICGDYVVTFETKRKRRNVAKSPTPPRENPETEEKEKAALAIMELFQKQNAKTPTTPITLDKKSTKTYKRIQHRKKIRGEKGLQLTTICQGELHQSVVLREKDLFKLVDVCSGDECGCGMYHCPLCETDFFRPVRFKSTLGKHIRTHFKYKVKVGDYSCCLCRLYCGACLASHYHCPRCFKRIAKRAQFVRHLEKHEITEGQSYGIETRSVEYEQTVSKQRSLSSGPRIEVSSLKFESEPDAISLAHEKDMVILVLNDSNVEDLSQTAVLKTCDSDNAVRTVVSDPGSELEMRRHYGATQDDLVNRVSLDKALQRVVLKGGHVLQTDAVGSADQENRVVIFSESSAVEVPLVEMEHNRSAVNKDIVEGSYSRMCPVTDINSSAVAVAAHSGEGDILQNIEALSNEPAEPNNETKIDLLTEEEIHGRIVYVMADKVPSTREAIYVEIHSQPLGESPVFPICTNVDETADNAETVRSQDASVVSDVSQGSDQHKGVVSICDENSQTSEVDYDEENYDSETGDEECGKHIEGNVAEKTLLSAISVPINGKEPKEEKVLSNALLSEGRNSFPCELSDQKDGDLVVKTNGGSIRFKNLIEMERFALDNYFCEDKNEPFEFVQRRNEKGEIEYPCQQCHMVKQSKDAIYRHYRRDHGEKRFKCTKCPRRYAQFTDLKQHLEHCNGNQFRFESNQCPVCVKEFANRKSLRRHFQVFHISNVEASFACTTCDKKFTQQRYLRAHLIRFHDRERQYFCSICNKGFKMKYHLKEHVQTHDKSKINYRWRCRLCQKAFQRVQAWEDHMNTHEGKKPHVCDDCNRTFSTRCALSKHRAMIHKKVRSFVCDICGEAFVYRHILKIHYEVRHAKKVSESASSASVSLQCEVCGLLAKSRRQFDQHSCSGPTLALQTAFACQQCGFEVVDESELDEHECILKSEDSVEAEERLFQCSICGTVFDDWDTVVAHVPCHSEKTTTDVEDEIDASSMEVVVSEDVSDGQELELVEDAAARATEVVDVNQYFKQDFKQKRSEPVEESAILAGASSHAVLPSKGMMSLLRKDILKL